MKIKLGDTVAVTRGKHATKRGKITKVFPKTKTVLVEGIGAYKRHLKPTQTGGPGKIVERFRPLPVGSVALVCPQCSKTTRVGYTIDKQGAKNRICRQCQGLL